MNQKAAVWVLILSMALVISGCNKKATDQANVASTGFENVGSQAELAQLPQANSGATQQGAIEVLPIETSPVTQGVPAAPMPSVNGSSAALSSATNNPMPAATTITTASSKETTASVSRNKQIQTALKNAGFYNGPVDGKIGNGSRKAISAFQSSKGLKADGKVGPRTWKALEAFLSGASSAATSASSSSSSTTGQTATQEGN